MQPQTSDDPTDSNVSLFMGFPNQFPPEDAWTDDAVSLLLTVVCR